MRRTASSLTRPELLEKGGHAVAGHRPMIDTVDLKARGMVAMAQTLDRDQGDPAVGRRPVRPDTKFFFQESDDVLGPRQGAAQVPADLDDRLPRRPGAEHGVKREDFADPDRLGPKFGGHPGFGLGGG